MSVKILNDDLKSNNFSSLYYIHGEEEYLKKFYFSELKSKVVRECVEFNVIEFDEKNFTYIDFTNAINSYPIMSDKKLVTVVDFDNSLLKKDFTKDFVEFLKNIPEYCVVVFFDSELKKISSSNPLLKCITSAKGLSVEVKRPDTTSLAGWANRHFKSFKKTISKEDLLYFLELADCDMLSLSNEISKLCNFVQDDVITKTHIECIVTKSIETNRYEITDAFCSRNYSKLFDIVNKLHKQCVDEIMISNIFYRAFVDMWKAKLATAKLKSSSDFASDFKINPYAATKIIKNSKLIPKEVLNGCLQLCLKLDKDLKSTPFNKKDLISVFIASIIECRNKYEQN